MKSPTNLTILAINILILCLNNHEVLAGQNKPVDDQIIARPVDPDFVLTPEHRQIHLKMVGAIDLIRDLVISAIDGRSKMFMTIRLGANYGKKIYNELSALNAESQELPDKIRPPTAYYVETAKALDRMFSKSDRMIKDKIYKRKDIDSDVFKMKVNKFFYNMTRLLKESPASIYVDWANVRFGDVGFIDESAELYTMMRVLGYDYMLSFAPKLAEVIRKTGARRLEQEKSLRAKL